MRWFAVAIGAALLAVNMPARAEILVSISKAQQQLTVTVDGAETYRWPVSTGKAGYDTPSGAFKAFRTEQVYFSKKYDDAPMPNAVFFHEGYAVHGTLEQSKLGNPVSHGCVRLSQANAATLFALVKQRPLNQTRIVVSDGPIASRLPDPMPPRASVAQSGRNFSAPQSGGFAQWADPPRYRDRRADPREVDRREYDRRRVERDTDRRAADRPMSEREWQRRQSEREIDRHRATRAPEPRLTEREWERRHAARELERRRAERAPEPRMTEREWQRRHADHDIDRRRAGRDYDRRNVERERVRRSPDRDVERRRIEREPAKRLDREPERRKIEYDRERRADIRL